MRPPAYNSALYLLVYDRRHVALLGGRSAAGASGAEPTFEELCAGNWRMLPLIRNGPFLKLL